MNLESLTELIPWLVMVFLGGWVIKRGRANKKLKVEVIDGLAKHHKLRNELLTERVDRAYTIWDAVKKKHIARKIAPKKETDK